MILLFVLIWGQKIIFSKPAHGQKGNSKVTWLASFHDFLMLSLELEHENTTLRIYSSRAFWQYIICWHLVIFFIFYKNHQKKQVLPQETFLCLPMPWDTKGTQDTQGVSGKAKALSRHSQGILKVVNCHKCPEYLENLCITFWSPTFSQGIPRKLCFFLM